MNSTDTTVNVVKRDGRLYQQLPDGSEAEIPTPISKAAASVVADPDNPPLSSYPPGRLKRRPQVYVIRRALKLTVDEFADRFRLPASLVQSWEAGTTAPDAAARAYLMVIAQDPDAVTRALALAPAAE